jgi:hypothetical protein
MGKSFQGTTMGLYGKNSSTGSKQSGVVFGKAEFEIGTAQFWGTDTKPMCAQIEKLSDFCYFKPETMFSPSWGLDETLHKANVNKK